MIECPNCKSPNDDNNQFCGKCGAKLPDLKYCPKCRYHSYENDFCIKCGEKLVSKEKYEQIIHNVTNLKRKGLEFKRKNMFVEALECYDEILKIRPEDSSVLMDKIWIYKDLGKFKEAIGCCDKRIELNSRDYHAYLSKGDCLSELGKFEEAIECYDKSILFGSNTHYTYINKGEALLELEKFDDALYCFDNALKIKNDKPLYFWTVVEDLCNFFKFKEAMDYCERGLNYYPHDIDLNFKKAKLLCLTDNYFDAKELILRYNLYCASLFDSVAQIFNLMGEFYKAKRFCEKSIDSDSQYYHSWLTMGEIYFNLNNHVESLKYFKKGFEISSEDRDELITGLTKKCQEFVKSNL